MAGGYTLQVVSTGAGLDLGDPTYNLVDKGGTVVVAGLPYDDPSSSQALEYANIIDPQGTMAPAALSSSLDSLKTLPLMSADGTVNFGAAFKQNTSVGQAQQQAQADAFSIDPAWQTAVSNYNAGKPVDPKYAPLIAQLNTYFQQGQASPGKMTPQMASDAMQQWQKDESPGLLDTIMTQVFPAVVAATMGNAAGVAVAGATGSTIAGAAAGGATAGGVNAAVNGGNVLQGITMGALLGGSGAGLTSYLQQAGLNATQAAAATKVITAGATGGNITQAIEQVATQYGVGQATSQIQQLANLPDVSVMSGPVASAALQAAAPIIQGLTSNTTIGAPVANAGATANGTPMAGATANLNGGSAPSTMGTANLNPYTANTGKSSANLGSTIAPLTPMAAAPVQTPSTTPTTMAGTLPFQTQIA